MAGTTVKTVKVVVAGDSSGAQGALDKLSSKSSSAASTIKGHLSGLFGSLSNSGMFGGVISQLQEIGSSLDGLELKGKSVGEKLAGVGIAAAGIGGALAMASQGDKAAAQQLGQAFTNVGKNVDDYKGSVDKSVSSMAKFGYNSKDTQDALTTLVTATKDPQASFQLLGTAANLAAQKHIDLASAVNMVAQVANGKGTRALTMLGIQSQAVTVSATSLQSAQHTLATSTTALSTAQQKLAALQAADHAKASLTVADKQKLKAAQDAVSKATAAQAYNQSHLTEMQQQFNNPLQANKANLDALSKATAGQAAAASDTWNGKLKELRAEVENHVAEIGQKYGPAIMATGAAMTAAGSAATATKSVINMFRGSTEAATTATEALAAAQKASGTAGEVMAVGETAADTAGLPLIATIGLIVLAVAAVVLAIYELVTHWNAVFGAIKAVVGDAVNFIKAHWELIAEILLAPIAPVLAIYLRFRDQFNAIFEDIVKFVSGIPGQIEGFFEAIPGTIVNFFDGIGDDFVGVGESIVNGLVSGIEGMGSAIWDAIKSHIPGSGVIGGALSAIGLAEGGIVTKPTLAMIGEAGYPEAVIPLKNGATVRGLNDAVQALPSASPQSGRTAAGGQFNVTQNVYLPTGTPEQFAQETTWALSRLVA